MIRAGSPGLAVCFGRPANLSLLPGLWRTKIDGQRQDSVFDDSGGVAENREIHVVELHLLRDHATFGPFDGRQAAPPDRGGSLLETLDHCCDIEGIGHVSKLVPATIWSPRASCDRYIVPALRPRDCLP